MTNNKKINLLKEALKEFKDNPETFLFIAKMVLTPIKPSKADITWAKKVIKVMVEVE